MTDTPTAHRSRPQLLLIGVLVLVILVAAAITLVVRRSDSTAASTRPAAPPTSATTEPSTTPATDPGLSEPAYVTEAKRQVSELRGLAWKSPLVVDVVSKDELARRTRAAIARDRRPEREAGDGDTFKILHLIPADLDYAKTIDDLLSGLVLGFYDPETKELVVGRSGGDDDGEINAATRLTLAHELNHALTDQWFDFGTATDALEEADREEELDGYVSLIEGDAKLLERRFRDRYLSDDEKAELLLGGLGGSGEDPTADLPDFLVNYLYFPYDAGLAFAEAQAEAASAAGPNAGVDAALRRPPTSTEQILHPELYAAGQGPSGPPSGVADWTPPALGDVAAAAGCETRRRGTLGEFKMQEILVTELSEEAAGDGADHWNGDTFETVRCGSSLGLVDRWQADTDTEAAELVAALIKWAPDWSGGGPAVDGRFTGPDGSGRIERQGTRVDLILADDRPTADRLAAAVG